jgi:hypothetical protein
MPTTSYLSIKFVPPRVTMFRVIDTAQIDTYRTDVRMQVGKLNNSIFPSQRQRSRKCCVWVLALPPLPSFL